MDSGVIAYVVPMFFGGLGISFVLRLLAQSWRWWLAALLGAVVPPSILLVADTIGSGVTYALDPDTVAAMVIIWAAAIVPALIGALCGVFFAARAKRRQEY